MQKNKHLLRWLMAILVITSMLYPSIHVFEHALPEFTQSKASSTTSTKTVLKATIADTSSEHCPCCDFTLASFVTPEFWKSFATNWVSDYVLPYYSKTAFTSYIGSFFCLRAPPVF